MSELCQLQISGLERRLKGFTFFNNKDVMRNFIAENLSSSGYNFSIPTVLALTDRSPKLEKELYDLYMRKFGMGNLAGIDFDIKILQASVLDGLVIGINVEKEGDFQVYTANTDVIFSLNPDSKFSLEKTLELNRKRVVHAVRIDTEYSPSGSVSARVVSLNKNTSLHIVNLSTFEGRFHLVPYIAIHQSMDFFREMLNDRRILDVRQDKGEINKARYITCRKDVLARFSDSKEFAESLKPSFFPLKGFFYAPNLGASSLTLGLTRIDLLDVCSVKTVKEPPVKKPSGGLSSVIKEASIFSILTRLYDNDTSTYADLVDRFPNRKEILTGAVHDVDKGVPNPNSIIKYIHGLSEAERAKVESLIPGLEEEVKMKESIISCHQELNPMDYSLKEIKSLLSTGVYKFVIQKSNCKYSTIVATNCPALLRKMYGSNYFAKYESLGVRIRKLERFITTEFYNVDRGRIEDWLYYCGFPISERYVSKIEELWSSRSSGNLLHEELVDLLGGNPKTTSRKTTRRSSDSEDMLLVRKCFASIISTGSVDYYRYLDMSKVVSMYRVG